MLELKNISFSVNDGGTTVEILRDVNLKFDDQKFIVITGPNGSGKSTLAKIIAGIEKPTSGKIIFNGEDITEKNITERANLGIGFAFQQPVRFKGLEVFDLLRLASGKNLKMIDACEYLSEVGLCAKDYINREVNSSLSGGELKRIEIATILARKSKFTIFDEPEAGIDIWSFQNLIKIFEKMRAEIRNSSIVIISHQERLLSIADEIILLTDGQVKTQGSGKEILPVLIGTKSISSVCDKLK
ncbi:MAG: ATP-binding cassette domain-containing protein [Selenomonadaceae bacterium]|nr:ATP-binding cassette domain-containing protein [Selenomonadaceae bacterium]